MSTPAQHPPAFQRPYRASVGRAPRLTGLAWLTLACMRSAALLRAPGSPCQALCHGTRFALFGAHAHGHTGPPCRHRGWWHGGHCAAVTGWVSYCRPSLRRHTKQTVASYLSCSPTGSEGAHVISEVAPSEGVSWWNQSHTLPRELSRSQVQEAKSGKSDRDTTSDYYRGFEAGIRSCGAGRVTSDKLPTVVRREGLALGGGSFLLVIVAALCGYRCRQGSRSQVAWEI